VSARVGFRGSAESVAACEEGTEVVEQPSGAFFSTVDRVEAVEVDTLFGGVGARESRRTPHARGSRARFSASAMNQSAVGSVVYGSV
jgi:hypothetical protein